MGIVGLAVGAMLTGLLLPLIVGERESVSSVAADEFGAGDEASDNFFTDTGAEDASTGDPGTSVDGVGDGSGGTDGSGGPTAAEGGSSSPGAAPRSGGGQEASAPSAGGGSPGAPLRSTDQGVSASTIKVGFLLLDLGQAGRIGVNTTGVDPKQQRAAFEALLADLNQRGGIHGRKVEGFYKVFDVTNPDDQRAACLAATEDAKVFAVIAMPGFANAAILCVTQEHRTPLIVTGQAISREFFRKSEGRLATLAMAGDRMMRNFAAELDAKGVLKGKTIGIVSSDEPQYIETVEGILVPALKQAGHKVGHVSRLATWPRSQGQIPPELQPMRAAGVDAVMFVGSFLNATTWVQAAEQQRWLPPYFVSEWGGMTSDFELQGMPQSFDGALAMTSQRFGEWRSDVPEPPSARRCIELYEKATGEKVPRNKGNESNSAYPVILYACDMLKVLEVAAKGAGPELTRPAWSSALQRSGAVEGSFYLPGAFRSGKTDLTDKIRFNRVDMGCRCWRNADAPRQVRFR